MVRAQTRLIDHLGIDQLLAVAGGSMGGFQALEWATAYPDRVRGALLLATTARSSAQTVAWNAIGRRAIMSDPRWRGGDYYGHEPPVDGLATARMIGHITYLSELSLERKFGRAFQRGGPSYTMAQEFAIELPRTPGSKFQRTLRREFVPLHHESYGLLGFASALRFAGRSIRPNAGALPRYFLQ